MEGHFGGEDNNAEAQQLPEQLLCVEYPGHVENVAAMMETLGGGEAVARTWEEPKRRMELRFRPSDVFCKPTYGERVEGQSDFVLRVLKLRRKGRDGKEETKIVHEVVGTVGTAFRFDSMCDFQYLPMVKEAGQKRGKSTYKSVYENVFIKKLEESSWLQSGPNDQTPLFIPPAVFSRMEQPQDYHFRREGPSAGSADAPQESGESVQQVIGRTRSRRSRHAIFVTFDMEKMPQRPREAILEKQNSKLMSEDDKKQVKEAFEHCPVWSKTALMAEYGIPGDRLKALLPLFAYFFSTGPWRNQWVRFGYDPRYDKDGSALLQTLDFRIRTHLGARERVKAKRSYSDYILPVKSNATTRPKPPVIHPLLNVVDQIDAAEGNKSNPGEETCQVDRRAAYIFRPGLIPPHRQVFYRLKDIHVDSVQTILAESLVDGDVCDERHGWFKPGTDTKVREIMSGLVNEQLSDEHRLGKTSNLTDVSLPDEAEESSSDSD